MTSECTSRPTGCDVPDDTVLWAVSLPDRPGTWKDPWPIEVAAATCARESVRAVEINYSIVEALDPARQQAACEVLTCLGIQIVSVHSPKTDCALENPDRAKRLAAVDRTARALRFCGQQGIARLVVHPCNRTSKDPRAIRDNLCRSIEELLSVARHVGVTMCLENMPSYHPFSSRPEDVPGIIEQFSDPNLRATFDAGHANMTGVPLEVFEAMRPYIAHTHLHDNSGDRDMHLPPGYGAVPWPALMPRLLQLRQQGVPLYIEAVPWSGGTSFARLQLETTALANACLGPGRYPSLRRPGEDDQWYLRRDPQTGQLVVFNEQGEVI